MRLELLGELAVVEVLVARELDLAQLELLALVHLEVDADGRLAERVDLEGDVGQVVALRPVEGLDAQAVLEEERVVEGRAGGERQDVANVVALEVVVAPRSRSAG